MAPVGGDLEFRRTLASYSRVTTKGAGFCEVVHSLIRRARCIIQTSQIDVNAD